jgi:hypothetical protein
MLGTALEFAAGTTEDCQRLVVGLFQQPETVLDTYRAARQRFGTGDLVLVTAEADPSGFTVMPRARYVAALRAGLPRGGDKLVASLGIAHNSAHKVVSLPKSSEAMWLIVNRQGAMPIMCVLFVAPFATAADAREPTLLS